MFDDLNNKAINQGDRPVSGGSSSGSASPKETTAPLNSRGGVEDIFSESDKPAGPVSGGAGPTSKGAGGLHEKPAVFQPKKETGAGLSGYSGASGEEAAAARSGNIKKLLTLAAIILCLALVSYGGYWAYSNFGKGILAPAGEETAGGEASDISGSETETADESGGVEEAAPVVEQPKDSDEDGLSDEEEEQLGTVSGSVDSDNDGLFDREEAKVYKTDPLKADTDGDGFSDGDEVKAGYDPKGPGKLYEIK